MLTVPLIVKGCRGSSMHRRATSRRPARGRLHPRARTGTLRRARMLPSPYPTWGRPQCLPVTTRVPASPTRRPLAAVMSRSSSKPLLELAPHDSRLAPPRSLRCRPPPTPRTSTSLQTVLDVRLKVRRGRQEENQSRCCRRTPVRTAYLLRPSLNSPLPTRARLGLTTLGTVRLHLLRQSPTQRRTPVW